MQVVGSNTIHLGARWEVGFFPTCASHNKQTILNMGCPNPFCSDLEKNPESFDLGRFTQTREKLSVARSHSLSQGIFQSDYKAGQKKKSVDSVEMVRRTLTVPPPPPP